MHTILGAGGSISNELAQVLADQQKPIRLVGRNPIRLPGVSEVVSADLADPDRTTAAVAGSQIVYLLAGLKYDRTVWQDLWPKIMTNCIQSCKRTGAKLIFFDNVYMYGPVAGPMTESTPFNPTSVKGEIRAKIAEQLLTETKSGNLTALIARSADFYGANSKTGIPNALYFSNLAKGGKANCLVADSFPHSYTYVPDAARALALLADDPNSWNQTWHMPTSGNPPTAGQFIEMAAAALNVRPRYRILSRPMIRLAGLFDKSIRELPEMLYQYDRPYLFDSSKFEKAFNFQPTPYDVGIRAVAAAEK